MNNKPLCTPTLGAASPTRTTPRRTPLLHALLHALLLATGLAGATASHAADAPPVEAFFKPVDMRAPALSPSGKYVALLAMNDKGHRQIVVVDTSDTHKMTVAASFAGEDVLGVQWVNDDRVLFWLGREDASAWRQPRNNLLAVDRDGSALRVLINGYGGKGWDNLNTHIKDRTLGSDHWLMRTLRDGTDDVIVGHALFKLDTFDTAVPQRLNTRTGQTGELSATAFPDNVQDWAINEQGKLLAASWTKDGREGVLLPDGKNWKPANEFDLYGARPGGLDLHDAIGDTVYVTAGSRTPERTSALYRLDPKTGKAEDSAVVSLKGFDFRGRLLPDLARHKPAGVRYVNDAPGTAWFTPEMRQLQAEVDAKLPGYVNEITPAECGCSTHALVVATSDHQPPVFVLYDSANKALLALGGERPWIEARRMADMDFTRIKTRDGLDMPVYVTKPAGKGPFPAVVLVHGGPFMRGEQWGFQEEPQFLASRGYAVIEPEFRGSAGYGSKLYEAGFKQWGLGMDDDLVDAVRWGASTGLVDAKRVCVMGASYGGYATLMALIKDPEVFRCGVASSAVTDIASTYDDVTSDSTESWERYGKPQMVGDRVKDAAQLEATSPLRQAARLKQPLLLAHGDSDRRVPIAHAEKLRSALLASGKTNLEWLRYGEEEHGLSDPKSQFDFYRHVEAFLAANIGPAAGAATATPAAK